MYLKALEIQGFKSFPEKTILEFEHDITAIVGPNGSGKSNISDALRWVMGEMSTKNLRGGKMEDVIFGGTEKRSPVGFAQVTLVIDNSGKIFNMENTEVSITRRYYRSGESEYYINRKAVRLRDINELLMDTGLGRDGYSIIGQGRIDEILSVRSTDRREIFEEAAGISRYRYRKEESERKLERTGENLLRINDKIAELELQVEPLRKQSETAKRYLILRDELRGIEISVWCENIERLRTQIIKFQSDCEENKRELEQARNEVERLYSDADSISEQMREQDLTAESLRSDITAAEAQSAALESDIAVCKANIQALEENIARLSDELSEQQNRTGNINSQIEEHERRIEQINENREKLSDDIKMLLTETEDISRNESYAADEIAKLLRNESEQLALVAEEKSHLSALLSAMEERNKRKDTISEERARIVERLGAENANVEKCKAELEVALEAANSAENVIKGYELRLQGKRKKADELSAKKTDITIQYGNITTRINMLREMEREYQGFSNAVKVVMRESLRGTLKGIYGPVANLLKTESKYALAVETALGASMQSIIVSDDEAGKAAINLLKRNNSGRGTFLPMSTMKGSVFNDSSILKENGFEGIAVELVSFDEQYRDVYTYLLGRIVIASDLDSAVRIGRKYANRFKIVTLDGQVVNAGGSLTGGSVAKNTGIITRANELEDLNIKCIKTEEQLKELNKELNQAERELSIAADEVEIARGQLRMAQDNILRLRTDSEHMSLFVDSLKSNISVLDDEVENIRQRGSSDDDENKRLLEKIVYHQSEAAIAREKVETLTKGQDKLREQNEKLLKKIAAVRESNASLEAEYAAKIAAMEELKQLRKSMSGDAEKRREHIAAFNAQISGHNAQIEQKNDVAKSTNERIYQMRAKLDKVTESRMQLEAEKTNCLKTGREKEGQLREIEREGARLEQKKVTAELEEKQFIDKLWDSYELSFTAAQAAKTELENIQKVTRRINELRREINSLGNPNIGAIEEFERVNGRYSFLVEQRDDIESSKSELESIIRGITSEMKTIFETEFKVINDSFKETFLELFGGGKAELVLEDENDVLNCGIEIRVQPPGKSLKTITLLSGGEKAFVAIAIYFAILKVRPTPFCVLDEIEAALDDANVLRFAEYLRTFSEKTQFLVITHRRGTMEGADELFGVTMQEHGVSKVLSIDLKEAEKTISE